MIVGSIKEDLLLEKRISITPETAKNLINLGLKVCIENDYATHVGIQDEEYKKFGVKISKNENEILQNVDIVIQLGLLSQDKLSLIKDGQTIIGILNPYTNKEKLNNLVKRKINLFS